MLFCTQKVVCASRANSLGAALSERRQHSPQRDIRLARSGNEAKAGTQASLKAQREFKLRVFEKRLVAKHGLDGTIRHEPPLSQHQHALATVVDKVEIVGGKEQGRWKVAE